MPRSRMALVLAPGFLSLLLVAPGAAQVLETETARLRLPGAVQGGFTTSASRGGAEAPLSSGLPGFRGRGPLRFRSGRCTRRVGAETSLTYRAPSLASVRSWDFDVPSALTLCSLDLTQAIDL